MPRTSGRATLRVTCLLLLALAGGCEASSGDLFGPGGGCDGRYFVTFRQGTRSEVRSTEFLRGRYQLDIRWTTTGGFAARMAPSTAHRLRFEPVVASVEPGGIACSDP